MGAFGDGGDSLCWDGGAGTSFPFSRAERWVRSAAESSWALGVGEGASLYHSRAAKRAGREGNAWSPFEVGVGAGW